MLDDIIEQLPGHYRKQIEQKWSRNVENINEVDLLRTIKAAAVPNRYHAIVIKTTIEQMSITVSSAMKKPLEMLSDAGMDDLGRRVSWPLDLVQVALNELRFTGRYFENEVPWGVLV